MVESSTPSDALVKVLAGALLLDVRENDEFAAGRSEHAHHIPLAELPDQLEDLPRATTIVCVCRSGGRSLRAAEFLAEHGFSTINVDGGMTAWNEAGLPMVSDGGEPYVL